MIRQATSDDLPRLMAVAAQFWALTPWFRMGVERDDIAICSTLENAIENGSCFVGDKGVIFGFMGPVWASPQHKIAVELAWWGAGEGMELLAAFEQWAKDEGAIGVQMSTLGSADDARTEEKLIKAGYRVSERGLFKGLI
jgi:GNAT superfamily N-acetyltransferase